MSIITVTTAGGGGGAGAGLGSAGTGGGGGANVKNDMHLMMTILMYRIHRHSAGGDVSHGGPGGNNEGGESSLSITVA